MAFTVEGVLRPVTCRTFTPWKLNTGSGTVAQLSPGPRRPRKLRLITPWEPATSPVVIGKLAAVSIASGTAVSKTPLAPGLRMFRLRVSAPAWK